VTGPRFAPHRTERGTFEVHDAEGQLLIVLQGAEACDADAARHYADRFNELSEPELEQLAVVSASGPEPETIDVDAGGLPTVKGYRQLYLIALEHLEAAEPSWSRKRRERVARDMTEAYSQGAIARARREPAHCDCVLASEADAVGRHPW
jgi:hypothetical protein